MSETLFLELDEGIGIEPSHVRDPKTGEEIENPNAGELGELRSQGLPIPVPVQVGNDIAETIQVATILPSEQVSAISLVPARIIPGTRTIETSSDKIAAAILNLGVFHIADPPKSNAQTRAKAPSKAELVEQAEALGLDVKGRSKRGVEEAITEHEAALAAAADGAPAVTTTEQNEEGQGND
jgi:hypothetical protein